MCSVELGVLKNFAKFTGKDLYWNVLSDKFVDWKTNTFFTEHLRTTASEHRNELDNSRWVFFLKRF